MYDGEILALFAARDERALRAVQEKYGGLCRGIAMQILNNAEDAEECMNDMLYQTWQAIPPEQPEKLSAYCAALTRNNALNRYQARKAAKRGGGQLPLVLEELAQCLPGGQGAEDAALARALGEAVNRFLLVLINHGNKGLAHFNK